MENEERQVSRREMKEEAVLRMKKLGISQETIAQFHEENKISYSCYGMNYWCDDDQKSIIADFEKCYKCFVYFGILSQREFGTLLTLFYVSNCKEDWPTDHVDLSEGYQCVYVHNFDYPYCSEFGRIAFERQMGGLIRTV